MIDELTRARADAEFMRVSDALGDALRDVLNDDAEDWYRAPGPQGHSLAERWWEVVMPAVERNPAHVSYWLAVLDEMRLRVLSVAATAKAARH